MCGIAGGLWLHDSPADVDVIVRMGSVLAHRGPDDAGVWRHGPVAMAHRRLSIIDPALSKQPMSSLDGRYTVCFNGEILNYRQLRRDTSYAFATSGDTEVLLALFSQFGPAGVERAKGQFAFALYDKVAGDLWLFRDRLGVLPLYYYADSDRVLFASEAKSLLAAVSSPGVDEAALGEYLTHRYVVAPRTLFKGIRKLEPGHFMRVHRVGADAPTRYWAPPEGRPNGTRLTDRQLTVGLRDVLATAVERNLVADVPVGAFLSGGVDSSVLVALMTRRQDGRHVHTFAAGFDDPTRNELPFARLVADHCRTRHHEVMVQPLEFDRLWPLLTWHRDAPLSEASDVALYTLARAASEHVKVAISGEGADELFAGYPKYRYASLTRWSGAVPGSLRSRVLGSAQDLLPPRLWRSRIAVRALAAGSEPDRYAAWFASFSPTEVARLVGSPDTRRVPSSAAVGSALRRMLATDVATWLPDNLLERADRMAMATSIETRPPYLDDDVVQFASGLSRSQLLRGHATKWALKEVARSLLPGAVVDRRKVGFRVPLDTWFRHGLRDVSRSRLLDRGSFVGQVLDRTAVERLLRRHDESRANEETRIWTLLALEIWHDIYFRTGQPLRQASSS